MKRLLFVLCFLWPSLTIRGEVIDRMVAVVNGHIITASDLRLEREILMRLGDKPLDDDKVLVQQMVDNYLIETEIADSVDVDVTDGDIDAELQKSVALEGMPSEAVREAVRRRIRMRKYVELRFSQYIHPSDEDIRKYYNDVFVPAAKTRDLSPIPPLEQVTDLIRNNVIQEGLNHEINIWLEAIRRKGNIEIIQ